jgi:hypothetical protein
LCLAAAIVLAIVLAAEWIAPPGDRTAASVLDPPRSLWTIGNGAILLSELSNIAYISLLVAFFYRSGDDSGPDVPLSKLLRLVTKVTVITWGVWLAINGIRVVYAPFGYFRLREYALQAGNPLQFRRWMGEVTFQLLTQACLFAAPYVVYRMRPGPVEIPISEVVEG